MRRLPQILTTVCCVLLVNFASAAQRYDYHRVRGRHPAAAPTGSHEGEALAVESGSRVQAMGSYGPGWSGGAHLLWEGRVGDAMKTSLRVDVAGRYRLAMRLTKAPDYGVFSLTLNGVELAQGIDLYSTKVELTGALDLGELALEEGEQSLVMTLTGANERAKKFRGELYLLGIDYLKLTPLDRRDRLPEENVEDLDEDSTTPKRVRSKVRLDDMRPVLAEYCFRCHGEGEELRGKVDLARLETKEQFLADIDLTRKISDVLEFHEMPPEDEKQLPEAAREQLTSLFDSYVDEYLLSRSTLTPTVMRRMNRYEYSNAVRDLLQLKGDLYPLPEKPLRPSAPYFDPASGRFPDAVEVGNRALGKNQVEQHILTGVVPFAIDLQAENGFNNRGDELSLSPILLESFLELGQSIVNSPEFDRYCEASDSLFRSPESASREDQERLGRKRLRPLLERAFRQPVDDPTAERYAGFFARELARTDSFVQSMKSLVAAILASPRFIYIVERKRDVSAEEPVTAYELATRLSFFLWSTIPDEELLSAARDATLREPGVLEAQVRRMLEDRRSQALSESFARQWLRLDQLITAVPDFERFERYYSRIGCEQWKLGLQSMVEPLLLFESILVEDRSIMLLIDSNYSYRSDELQSWYRDAVPFGGKANRDRFNTNMQAYRRRSPGTRREGGVITTAAVLTMTSSPLRTNPIRRGAWVASVILNKPPPPPPDLVPEIEKDDAEFEAKGLTLRQRLEEHKVNESCASCHEKIDPLGFALENFDAVGRWRDEYRSGLKIDAGGELFGEAEFNDVVGLKDALLERPERFMRAFSEHLLSYALGRELQITDRPAVDRIVRKVLRDRGQFSTVVTAIATSYPFLHKTNQLESEK